MERKTKTIIITVIATIVASAILFFGFTPIGRSQWNAYNHTMQKVDDSTLYATRKKVEDQCRASISSYERDELTWNQYKDSDSELERSWANQAKMRANKTASVYNNYILKNKYVFEGNIPADIYMELVPLN